jgi:hypothetical protein
MAGTTVKLSNSNKPAPKWFRKLRKAIGILTLSANVMIAGWGFTDELATARLQLWCTVGIGAIMEALGALLANGDDYVSNTEENNDNENI